MKQISTTKFHGYDGSLYTRYKKTDVYDLDHLSNLMKTFVWSPCVWKGIRRKANFVFADYFALDFDDGLFTLKDAEEYVKDLDLAAVIGTTKSHQKPKISGKGKHSPACDRFRLVLQLDRRTSDLAEYEQNYLRMRDALGCDKTQDGGRLFYPCVDIVLINRGKLGVTVNKPKAVSERRQYARVCDETRRAKILPQNLKKALAKGLREHNHNNFTFWFSCRMKEQGLLSPDEIFNLIHPQTHMTEREMRATISSAFKTAVKK